MLTLNVRTANTFRTVHVRNYEEALDYVEAVYNEEETEVVVEDMLGDTVIWAHEDGFCEIYR